ncbi:MAG: hypothetical protein H0V93_02475 [Euzebyales bacterium]|jgi:hypothetical protein|nr:hypothetical protein [Euzebyales bacterium]
MSVFPRLAPDRREALLAEFTGPQQCLAAAVDIDRDAVFVDLYARLAAAAIS